MGHISSFYKNKPILLFLFAVIVASSFLQPIVVGSIKIKIAQISFIIFIIFNYNYIFKIPFALNRVDVFTNAILWLGILGFGLYSFSYSVLPLKTFYASIQLLLNLFIFYTFMFFLCSNRINYIFLLSKLSVLLKWLTIGSVAHYLIAFITPTIFIQDIGAGFLGGGRSTLFFMDCNWFAVYAFFISILLYDAKENGAKKVMEQKYVALCMTIISIMTGSRIIMALFLLHYLLFYLKLFSNKRSIILVFIVFLSYIFLPIFLLYLPERFFYDITDLDQNPRFNDTTILIDEVNYYHRQLQGFGWSTVNFISNNYSWRDFDGSINVLPAQIYFDFGQIGLYFYGILLAISFIWMKKWSNRFILFVIIVILCFHRCDTISFFWIFMAFFYYKQNYFGSSSKLLSKKKKHKNLLLQ